MMSEQFSDVLGELSDRVILEANEVRCGIIKKTAKTKRRLYLHVAAAMVASLTVTVGLTIIWNKVNPTLQQNPELPKLSCELNNEGCGFEGYMAFDISELVNANPWDEGQGITVLPIYKNNVTYDENGIRELIYDAAKKMNIAEVNEIKKNRYFPGRWESDMGDFVISAEEDGSVQIEYIVNKKIPDEYVFNNESSREELKKLSEHIEKKYDDFIDMQSPTLNIYGGDYDIYGEQRYKLSYYDKSGDIVEQILNYNLKQLSFLPGGDNNSLWFIRYKHPNLTVKMGDYPVITEKEAEQLMEEGYYASSAPYEFPGKNYIAKVELVYLYENYNEYIMPYFKFYVELPEESKKCDVNVKNGMKCFGAYYVPAVDGRYITNMPMYNGEFN